MVVRVVRRVKMSWTCMVDGLLGGDVRRVALVL